MAITILAPIGYLFFLIGSLYTFSKIQRSRKANKPIPAPWFPQHKARDIYISLLSIEPLPPRAILVSALLRRAMEDVKLIWSVRDAKASLGVLHERGQIGDDLWERFTRAEKELEIEIIEVVGEANTFQEGYGNTIFGVASEMVNHEKWKEIYEGIAEARIKEKANETNPVVNAAILAPFTYLTPSSLTLQPSNPLPDLPTTSPVPSPFAALTAPFPSLPSAPPSRTITPLPDAIGATTNATKALPPPTLTVPNSPEKLAAAQLPTTPAKNLLSPVTSPNPGTPSSTKKKNKKKKGKVVTTGEVEVAAEEED